MAIEKLEQHDIALSGNRVVLRPMTEKDWGILLLWNSDPEVLWFAEGKPIGECWLQEMNLERILINHPEDDCRRIDLMIGEKDLWGKGYGTEVIATLTDFGFVREKADLIFGCSIADCNARSLRAFKRNGYRQYTQFAQPPGGKAKYDIVVFLRNS